jgi:hypothetical protein
MMLIPKLPTSIRFILTAIIALAVIVGLRAALSSEYYRGPAQPIPFSHRLHASTKQINCFFCHQYASVSSNAGVPPESKCLLCHNVIASRFPPISQIARYKGLGQGIPWVRVNGLPDFVQFSHQCHIARGHDCSECHGNVKSMDRIVQVKRMDMNFCVTCHWQNKASVNCYICHY